MFVQWETLFSCVQVQAISDVTLNKVHQYT